MSFTVRLGADVTSVDAGTSVPLAIEIANRSDEAGQFELEIEGIDPEWTAVPVPTFSVEAHEVQVERVFFKPPRESQSLAGNYPFVVKLRSLVTGESRTAQGLLEIQPYNHLSAEINPKRGSVTPLRKQEDFDLTILNLGNTSHTLQLFGSDPEDECTFSFEPEQVTIGAGQQKEVYVGVGLNAHRWFSSARLFGFSVSGRSIESPSVVCTAQAQLERKPLLSPAGLIAFMLFVFLAIGWWLLMPKPPRIVEFALDKATVTAGEPITVMWQAANATGVELEIAGSKERKKASGELVFTPQASGEVVIVAVRDGKRSDPQILPFTVNQPEPIPDPTIVKFSVKPTTVNLGESVIVSYELGESVTRATLEPIGLELNLLGSTQQVTPTLTGTVEYTLVAVNSAGKSVKKTVKVTVVEASTASIVKFDGEPKVVPAADGKVTLTWQLNNAARAEISDGDKTTEVDPSKGNLDFVISRTTEFTLTGYDTEGRTVSKKIKIKMEEPPKTEDPAVSPAEGGTGI